ncbi:hypothetical protein [uncultured Shewanella sp.]|uniref:hypothetical protein n=1 Tax=uncultured Shewanella sp. TaxID=173975 RepID=UPI0026156C56|nr:hypothetical protein [uncultured Shewanella sp.]
MPTIMDSAFDGAAYCPRCHLLMYVKDETCPHCAYLLSLDERNKQKGFSKQQLKKGLKMGTAWTLGFILIVSCLLGFE